MISQSISKPKGTRLPSWIVLVLVISGGMVLAVLCVAILFVSISGGGSLFWRHLEIKADDIPMYPNAMNITSTKSTSTIPEVDTWSFTTTDTPEIVWRFYVNQMGRKWGFYDASSPQDVDKSLLVQSCPFYSLEMSSTSIDARTYDIIIRFEKVPCL